MIRRALDLDHPGLRRSISPSFAAAAMAASAPPEQTVAVAALAPPPSVTLRLRGVDGEASWMPAATPPRRTRTFSVGASAATPPRTLLDQYTSRKAPGQIAHDEHLTAPSKPAGGERQAERDAATRRELELRRAFKGEKSRLLAEAEEAREASETLRAELSKARQEAAEAQRSSEEQRAAAESAARDVSAARAEAARLRGEEGALRGLSAEALEALERGSLAALTAIRQAREEAARRARTCVVCMAAPRSAVFLPCGHAACCADCVDSLRRHASQAAQAAATLQLAHAYDCPICKRPVASAHRVFWA
mmetsp:Transcript_693/g.2212  ORF Transcript_693/g.2212 Transcript_693/m.2212 type:complete len:307 (+) Transcript_693:102-1022(+)